ncbi:hypothetical protein C8R45DRAFT_1188726 [Mycena sanguinolenta]|nr:hypothetical protein C8R45DRAFT_1188726 [Mycena sanguinolenta]
MKLSSKSKVPAASPLSDPIFKKPSAPVASSSTMVSGDRIDKLAPKCVCTASGRPAARPHFHGAGNKSKSAAADPPPVHGPFCLHGRLLIAPPSKALPVNPPRKVQTRSPVGGKVPYVMVPDAPYSIPGRARCTSQTSQVESLPDPPSSPLVKPAKGKKIVHSLGSEAQDDALLAASDHDPINNSDAEAAATRSGKTRKALLNEIVLQTPAGDWFVPDTSGPLPAVEVVPEAYIADALVPPMYSIAPLVCTTCINRGLASSCTGGGFGKPCAECTIRKQRCIFSSYSGIALEFLGPSAMSASLALMHTLWLSCDRVYVQLLQLLEEFLRAHQHAALVFRTQQEHLPRDLLESYLANPDHVELLEQFSESVGLSMAELQFRFPEAHPTTDPVPRVHQPGHGGFSSFVYEKIPPSSSAPEQISQTPGFDQLSLDVFSEERPSPGSVNTDVPPVQDPPFIPRSSAAPQTGTIHNGADLALSSSPMEIVVDSEIPPAPEAPRAFQPGTLLVPPPAVTTAPHPLRLPELTSSPSASPWLVPPPPCFTLPHAAALLARSKVGWSGRVDPLERSPSNSFLNRSAAVGWGIGASFFSCYVPDSRLVLNPSVPKAKGALQVAEENLLSAYKDVLEVDKLNASSSVCYATLSYAIKMAHAFIPFKEAMLSSTHSGAKEALYDICSLHNTARKDSQFNPPPLMDDIHNTLVNLLRDPSAAKWFVDYRSSKTVEDSDSEESASEAEDQLDADVEIFLLGTAEVTEMVNDLQMEVDSKNSQSTTSNHSGSGSVPSNLHFSKQVMGASLSFWPARNAKENKSVCLYCGSLAHSDAECLLKSKHKDIRDKEVAEASRKSKVSLTPLIIDDPIEFPARKVIRFFPIFGFPLTAPIPAPAEDANDANSRKRRRSQPSHIYDAEKDYEVPADPSQDVSPEVYQQAEAVVQSADTTIQDAATLRARAKEVNCQIYICGHRIQHFLSLHSHFVKELANIRGTPFTIADKDEEIPIVPEPTSRCLQCIADGVPCYWLSLGPLPFSHKVYTVDQLLVHVPAAYDYLRKVHFNYQKKILRKRLSLISDLGELLDLYTEFHGLLFDESAQNLVTERIAMLPNTPLVVNFPASQE